MKSLISDPKNWSRVEIQGKQVCQQFGNITENFVVQTLEILSISNVRLNQLLQLCTIVWSDPVIGPVSVHSGQFTAQMENGDKLN